MAITVNGAFIGQALTGVQRYSYEICRLMKINSFAENRVNVKIISRSNANCAELDPQLTAFSRIPRAAWLQFVLPFYVDDVLLSLGNIGSLAVRNQILCIHDANIKIMPESYSKSYVAYQSMMMHMLGRTCKIISTVSSFSAESLVKFNIVKSKQIQVIRNGHEHVFRWNSEASLLSIEKRLEKPFVLIIGSRAIHKNIALVRGLSSQINDLGFNIVIAGGEGDVFRKENAFDKSDNVIILGRISDDDLAYLYKKADALLFPSFTEGFGIPLVEAMALGCPTIASNSSSLPEVGGSAVLYADPKDGRTWLQQLRRLNDSRALRLELQESGRDRVRKFSWHEATRLYTDLALRC